MSCRQSNFTRTLYRAIAAFLVASLSVFESMPSATAQEWADLQLTFVYDAASAPAPEQVDMSRDPICTQAQQEANHKPMSEELLVDPATKGIKNIAFYPDRKKSGLEPSDYNPGLLGPAENPLILDNKKCVFVPHIVVAKKGDTIKVINSDKTGHNANFSFFNNAAVNPLIPIGGSKDIKLVEGESAPTPVTCNIHPWMTAYVIAFEHPYTGLSDEKGVLKIEKLPVGKPITFKVWHENMDGSIEQVDFAGKQEEWKKGLVTITLKPGMNDLGVVKIKPDEFKKK